MKQTKLLTILAVTVLIACLAGLFFVPSAAQGTRVPVATKEFSVATVQAISNALTGTTWSKDSVVKLNLSADLTCTGELLFGVPTVFRADGTQLPIVVSGDNWHSITLPAGRVACTNDYIFDGVTLLANASGSTLFAGSGEIAFEMCSFTGSLSFYGDNFAAAAFDGWDSDKVTANADEDGLIPTSITFGEGASLSCTLGQVAAVGYGSINNTSAVIRTPAYEGATASTLVAPENTTASIIIDTLTQTGDNIFVETNEELSCTATAEFGPVAARTGFAPVKNATVHLISGVVDSIYGNSDINKDTTEYFHGDITLKLSGGAITDVPSSPDGNIQNAGLFGLYRTTLVGNLSILIEETDEAFSTLVAYVTPTRETVTVTGTSSFTMTGGTILRTYYGAPLSQKGVFNELSGGTVNTFFAVRYNQVLSTNAVDQVSIHNKVSGNVTVNNFYGGSFATAVGNHVYGGIRNEVSGGTIGVYAGSNRGLSSVNFVENVISGGTFTNNAYMAGFEPKVLNSVRNMITGGDFQTFLCGGSKCGQSGSITNILTGVDFPTAFTFVGGNYDTSSSSTCTKVENQLSDCIFKGTNYLGGRKGTVSSHIKNTIDGCTFEGFVVGGNNQAVFAEATETTPENRIETEIIGGTFTRFYGGNYNHSYTGNIKNTVKGGSFSKFFCGGPLLRSQVGNIENVISGGTFQKYYGGAYGTGENDNIKDESLSITGNVTNTVSGGTFYGYWGGTYRYVETEAPTHPYAIKGDITNTVSGGTFRNSGGILESVFSGGCFVGSHEGNVQTTISGGHFEGVVYGGSVPATKEDGVANGGSSTVTLSGGVFSGGIDANSGFGSYATTSLTALLSETSKITFYGETALDSLNSEGGVICLGPETDLTVAEANGTVSFLQIGGWLNRDYFTYTTGNLTVTEIKTAPNAYGTGTMDGKVLKGSSDGVISASFVLNNQIQLRFAVKKEYADQIGNFKLSAMMSKYQIIPETAASEANLMTATDETVYYTFLSKPLRAAELNYDIVVTMTETDPLNFKILDLAKFGIEYYGANPALSELLKSICNYAAAAGNYASGGSDIYHTEIPYEHDRENTGFTPTKGFLDPSDNLPLTIQSRSMVLGSGISVCYYGKLNEGHTFDEVENNLAIFVNSVQLEADSYKIVANKNGYDVAITIPLSVADGSTRLRVIMRDKDDRPFEQWSDTDADTTNDYDTYDYGKVWLDRIERLDTLAEAVADLKEQNALAGELGEQLLYYLQSAVAYQESLLNLKKAKPDSFSAGFGRADISPYAIHSAFSGTNSGKEVLDPIHVTCLALWDGENTTLMFTMDVRQAAEFLVDHVKDAVSRETGVSEDRIFLTVTHNHSAPSSTNTSGSVLQWFRETVFPASVVAAKQAILDLQPATAYVANAVSADGTNFVRRYRDNKGWRSVNDGKGSVDGFKEYESVADKTLRTLRFAREGKDILLVNWQGHAAHAVNYHKLVTADFIKELRVGLEDEDTHFMYYNGGTANLNFQPYNPADAASSPFRIKKTENETKQEKFVREHDDYIEIGKSLVDTVGTALKNEKKIHTGKVNIRNLTYDGVVRQDTEADYQNALLCREESKTTDWDKAIAKKYGTDQRKFTSQYEVSNIIERYEYIQNNGPTKAIYMHTVTFGDMAFALAPFEMFDETAKNIRDASGYEMTFACGYTNGYGKYMPTETAFINGGYEVHACHYESGTAEECEAILSAALKRDIVIKPSTGGQIIIGGSVPLF